MVTPPIAQPELGINGDSSAAPSELVVGESSLSMGRCDPDIVEGLCLQPSVEFHLGCLIVTNGQPWS